MPHCVTPAFALGLWGQRARQAYPFTLARRAVVVTMDLSARNLHLLRSDQWLADPRNVSLVKLTEPAFGPPPVAQPDNRTLMLGWPVAGVAAFFESQDAGALGASLAANSVQGKGLLRFTVGSLKADLRLNACAAQKICDIRGEFSR